MPANAPSTIAPIFLQTLGGAGLYATAGGDLLLGPGKPLALLVFVASAPGRRTSRESLIDLLWSDVDRDRARNSLRQSLYQLRRVLGDEALAGSEELALTRPIDVDREQFLAALDGDDLDAALEHYRGSFLPQFGVPGGAGFEQWADLERDRLQAGFVRGAELLVRRLLNQSRLSEAKSLARRVRERVQDIAPHIEAAGRLMLEVSIAARDFVSAAMDANTLEQWSVAEGVVLEPATRAAIARARRVTPTSTSDPGADRQTFELFADLTGREQEFFVITSAWEAVRTGPARHLHLSAPAGFGKTRLLHDAVARLEAAGATIVPLRGKPGDRDLPFALAGDLAAAIAELPGAAGVAPASISTLLALNPALSTRLSGAADASSGEEMLRRRILAMTDLVQSVAHEQRFVLAIDDLHWIDVFSMRVLEGLWSRLNGAHVLCLTASRPEHEPSVDQCTLLSLAALTESQVGALVGTVGSVPSDQSWSASFVTGLFAATRGSPLLVLETLRLALDQEILALDANEWRCRDETRLASLLRSGEALRERMRALPEEELWTLAMLATVGAPCDRAALSAMTDASRDELAARVEPLERHGLIARTAAGLAPAHDEIAAAALAALTDAQRAAAERRVGEFFASSSNGMNGVLRAVRHFEAGGDTLAVQRLFRQYTQLARQRGDRRSYAELAAEVIGADAPAARITSLVRDVPRSWRMGLWSPIRQLVAVALVLLVPVLTMSIWRLRAASEATLQRLVFVDSTQSIREVAASADDWNGQGAAIRATTGRSDYLDAAQHDVEIPPVVSPDGRSVAWTQDSGDSTTLDIWLRTPSGVRRLTRQVRDDRVTGWLPDGSALIGVTDRWSQPGSLGYDVAVFDTATGAARAISHGPAHDGVPQVSPDGTRVAFVRESDESPPRLCVIAIDGRGEPECRFIDGNQMGFLVGWSGLDELVLVVDAPDDRPMVAYDWLRKTTRVLLGPHVSSGRLSPDRRWVAATLRIDGVRGSSDWVAPIERPAQARPIAGIARGARRWWEGRADSSRVIDRIEFADTTTTVLLGIGTRLRVRPLTRANVEVPLRAAISWTSSDTTVATVDSTGEVHPRTSGVATVTASLAGWRTVRRTLRVEGEAPTTVLDERWDGRWPTRWIAWGDPTPLVVNGPGGTPGFWNHGDGVYASMAVSRRSVSAQHGLGVEVRVSTPLAGPKWQRFRVVLAAGLDTSAFLAADQRKAPPMFGRTDAMCGVNFPGSGRWGETRFSASSGSTKEFDLGALGRTLRSGAWWTLRLQLLPDGRCGVAINNRVVWMSSEPVLLDGEYRVRLGDESANTKILHGPLQLWTGVRTDIDWSHKP